MHKLLSEKPKPTLEAQHLQQLSEEASLEVAESFAADYTALLPQRVERIVRTVSVLDRGMAMDASLTLKSTSWLAGALRMNQLCRQLELALALAEWPAAISTAQDIVLHLPRLQDALACLPSLTSGAASAGRASKPAPPELKNFPDTAHDLGSMKPGTLATRRTATPRRVAAC